MARRFYGLHDREIREVTEFYLRLEDADRELAEMLHDEPGWRGRFEIVVVDFGGAEVVVRHLHLDRYGAGTPIRGRSSTRDERVGCQVRPRRLGQRGLRSDAS